MAVVFKWEETNSEQEASRGVLVEGPTDRNGVFSEILANVPLNYGSLVFKTLSSANLIEGYTDLWDCRITYGAYREKSELKANESEFQFSSVKRNIKRTISIASRAFDSSGSITPLDLQVIGWKSKDSRAEGTEDTEYLNGFSWRTAVPFSVASESWRRQVGQLRGSVNSDTFFGYDAESVLFDDITGRVTGDSLYEFTLTFIQSPNLTGVSIGGISVGNIKGHEVIDVGQMKFKIDGTFATPKRVPVVDVVKIHQVKEVKSWSALSALLGV